jgi:hypothetical protein
MPGPCEACVHFRPARQLADLFGLAWSNETAETLGRNRQTEEQLHTAENHQKRLLMEAERIAWPRRPQVLAYCGLREDQDVYFIREMKNRGRLCGSFRAAPAQAAPGAARAREQSPRSCDTCAYEVRPLGPARDARVLRESIDPSQNWYNDAFGNNNGSARRVLGDVDTALRTSETRKAAEMRIAMQGDGILPKVPEYYEHCTKYSRPGAYVLCQSRNPHGQCPAWSARGGSVGGAERW